MTVSFSGTEPITLVINGEVTDDDLGDPVPSQTEQLVYGLFAPGNSTENGAQDSVFTQPAVFFPGGLPAGITVSWIDAVKVRGTTYQVTGVPGDWRGPASGASFGVVVRLGAVLAEPES